MAVRKVKAQVEGLVDSMIREGAFGNYFYELQKMSDDPGFIAELLPMACEATEKHLNQLERLLNEDTINYPEINKCALQMKETIQNTGAIIVPAIAEVMRSHCRNKNKEGCVKTLGDAKWHFNYLREKLDTIVQLQNEMKKYMEEEEEK